jgi:flagellar protein FlaG
MDIRFDAAARGQSVTPAQPAADATAKRQDDPAGAERERAADPAAIARTVTQLQDRVQTVHRELRFRLYETTGMTFVRVVEAETGQLIRQIPNQNVLDLHAFLQSVNGLLVSERA